MNYLTLRFQAMGCPCEILLDPTELPAGQPVAVIAAEHQKIAIEEAQRIEKKYSRYLQGNIIDRINTSQGAKIAVDEETAALLDYAAQCYDLSGGLFDITSGALRNGPDPARVGWGKVRWERPFIQLPAGFELDLGGICKEYAADRILERLRDHCPASTLVNLGGDIAAAGRRVWSVGIDDVAHPGRVVRTLYLRQGAIATSGTTQRPGHIRDPHTGRPVTGAPESVTVATQTCTEAGFWSTLAVLQGAKAEHFLAEQGLEFWCYRLPSSSSR